MIKDLSFGALLHEIRIANGETLRGYCLKRKLNAGNISKLERNLIAPPNTMRQLKKYLHGMKYTNLELELLTTAAINYHIRSVHNQFGNHQRTTTK